MSDNKVLPIFFLGGASDVAGLASVDLRWWRGSGSKVLTIFLSYAEVEDKKEVAAEGGGGGRRGLGRACGGGPRWRSEGRGRWSRCPHRGRWGRGIEGGGGVRILAFVGGWAARMAAGGWRRVHHWHWRSGEGAGAAGARSGVELGALGGQIWVASTRSGWI